MLKEVHCGSYQEDYDHTDWRYNDVKEMLSHSYLSSIASYIGAAFIPMPRTMDNDGADASIRMPMGRMEGVRNPNPALDVQMKATSTPGFDREMRYLNFDIGTGNYQRMHNADRSPPIILMVLVLPEDKSEWLKVEDEKQTQTRYMLWYNVADCTEKINNKKTIRLKIPLNNRVNADSLSYLLKKSANMEAIHNDV